jgi:hypothetical protein
MGSRADFYIGTGEQAEWLGSVAWDGYEWREQPDCVLSKASTESEFRTAVSDALSARDDATLPADGWPWPWDDSNTTDYSYVFNDGKVTAYCFGRLCIKNDEGEESTEDDKTADFPNMSARKNVQWGKKSGVMLLGG